jgi:hypothetical protein
MRFAERLRGLLAVGLLLVLGACGGGNSSETRCIPAADGSGCGSGGPSSPEVVLTEPQGPNTTEIVVDSGPGGGFSLAVANLPYVTVKVCAPGSASACVTIDHVFLDTGSIGLRVLRSAVQGLGLPPLTQGAGTVTECYPFVIGAVWGPMATADLSIGGERATGLPIQLIDDVTPRQSAAPADCIKAANGSLLDSMGSLQAKGVLGISLLKYDCGAVCEAGNYTGTYTLYYSCSGDNCTSAAVPATQQTQNPVSSFLPNADGSNDNNGSIVILPALPTGAASVVRGRLVFGIETQANNGLLPASGPTRLFVETDTTSLAYLYLAVNMNGKSYPYSYIDSGSNGFFFDDGGLPTGCAGNGSKEGWYCPAATQSRSADILDIFANKATINFSVANADTLFSSSNTAFANLAGTAGSANPGAFVWGLPFFYGRRVATSIWGQLYSEKGPWYSF